MQFCANCPPAVSLPNRFEIPVLLPRREMVKIETPDIPVFDPQLMKKLKVLPAL